MKPDLASLGLDDGPAPADDKPSIGDALGIPADDPDGDQSGTDVTSEAKKECGDKLLSAFESKDPMAMFDAFQGAMSLLQE